MALVPRSGVMMLGVRERISYELGNPVYDEAVEVPSDRVNFFMARIWAHGILKTFVLTWPGNSEM